MATPEERLEALGRLAKILCDDDSVLNELALAWKEPERYVARFAKRLDDRAIQKPVKDLAFIALINALQDRKRCVEIDWRQNPREVVSAVRALLRALDRKGWKAPKLDDGAELAELLRVLGSSLEGMGLSLCDLNHPSDSYALVLMATDRVEAATEFARLADVGRLNLWRANEAPVEAPSAIRLRTVTTIDVESPEPPRQFFALPRRRIVTFDGRMLAFASPEGAGRVPLDRELLPDFDSAAAAPRHVLVRSGQHFGVASRQFVRLWSPAGASVLYSTDPPLAADPSAACAGAASGGISDHPAVVVALFRGAAADTGDLQPCVLRLATGKKKTARLDDLDVRGRLGHLGAMAWLKDAPYVVARAREDGSPSYALYSRSPSGDMDPLVELGEDCTSRVSSSFAHLLVTYFRREGSPCVVFSLAHPEQPPRPLELPAGATALDHEDDAFWYFEPRASGGRYVLADPVNP